MIIAAALSGALIMTGVVVGVGELTRRAPAAGIPPARMLAARRLTAARTRIALALLAGLVMLALTRWPVAALAAAAAVIFVPKVTAVRAARQRTGRLEALSSGRAGCPTC